jgi:uncharacterized RDD family membrane protein YckC
METPDDLPPTEEHLLAEFEVNLQQASTGRRIANLFIDAIGFYVFIFMLAMAVPGFFRNLLGYSESPMGTITSRLMGQFLYGVYMGGLETVLKGKSFGKLVTRTRAVEQDGSILTPRTAILRGLSRAIPFEAFSAFGSPPYPWHDRWTHSLVIDEKASIIS